MSNFIQLRKLWEDDDDMLKVELSASNGSLSTTQDFYTYPENLAKFGKKLEEYFPKLGKGEVVFEYGSEVENYYSFVKLRFFYIRLGCIGIQVRTNNNEDSYESAICEFCIETTLQSVNDLGKQIDNWVKSENEAMLCAMAPS